MTTTGDYHKKRSEKAVEMRLAFAHAYNALLRGRLADPFPSRYGIKIRAAILAGFGRGSYDEISAYKTRRVMASKMMKDELVINTLKTLGLEPHPFKLNEWRLPNESEHKL